MNKETLTKAEMAALMGMSVEVFDEEIKNAGKRETPPMNRAMCRKLGIPSAKKKGRR